MQSYSEDLTDEETPPELPPKASHKHEVICGPDHESGSISEFLSSETNDPYSSSDEVSNLVESTKKKLLPSQIHSDTLSEVSEEECEFVQNMVKNSKPEIIMVKLTRHTDIPLGLGLVSGMHTRLSLPGIFVKTIVPDGIVDIDGTLKIGDRIAAVNGVSVVTMDYDQAIDLIRKAEVEIKLLILRTAGETGKLIRLPSKTLNHSNKN